MLCRVAALPHDGGVEERKVSRNLGRPHGTWRRQERILGSAVQHRQRGGDENNEHASTHSLLMHTIPLLLPCQLRAAPSKQVQSALPPAMSIGKCSHQESIGSPGEKIACPLEDNVMP